MTKKPVYKLIPFPNEEGEYIAVSNEKENKVISDIVNTDKMHKITLSMAEGQKIVASTKLIHPSIPLMRKEQIVFDDVNKTIVDELDRMDESIRSDAFDIGFSIGARILFDKHAETYKYTMSDAERIFEAGRNYQITGENNLTELLASINYKKEYIVQGYVKDGFFEITKISAV